VAASSRTTRRIVIWILVSAFFGISVTLVPEPLRTLARIWLSPTLAGEVVTFGLALFWGAWLANAVIQRAALVSFFRRSA
jgi:hypothetical protein